MNGMQMCILIYCFKSSFSSPCLTVSWIEYIGAGPLVSAGYNSVIHITTLMIQLKDPYALLCMTQ